MQHDIWKQQDMCQVRAPEMLKVSAIPTEEAGGKGQIESSSSGSQGGYHRGRHLVRIEGGGSRIDEAESQTEWTTTCEEGTEAEGSPDMLQVPNIVRHRSKELFGLPA